MALALLDNCLKRIIRITNANPSAWSASVSGRVGSFPDDNEITAACLEADELVCNQGYFPSINRSLSQPFMTYSANISHGDKIPFFKGHHGKVLLSTDNFSTSNIIGIKVTDEDNLKLLKNYSGSYFPTNVFNQFYNIDKEGLFLHFTTYGKVELPVYTRTSTLQAQKSEETLIIATAIRLLVKHATPVVFEPWINESVRGIQELVANGIYTEQMSNK